MLWVARQGVLSNFAQVAIIKPTLPQVNPAKFMLAQSASGNLLEIRGSNFGTDHAKTSVTLTPGAITVTAVLRVYDNLILVQLGDTTSSNLHGPVFAVVTHTDYGTSGDPAGTPIQVAVLAKVGRAVPTLTSPIAPSANDRTTHIWENGYSIGATGNNRIAVSYTHLTLPTIRLV